MGIGTQPRKSAIHHAKESKDGDQQQETNGARKETTSRFVRSSSRTCETKTTNYNIQNQPSPTMKTKSD
eukprot:scaffold279197_cov35-Attheya_sp.AAC.1